MATRQPQQMPPQHQNQKPGLEQKMTPQPVVEDPDYIGSGKLMGKVALITGGDSGIGKATAILFAKEGADVAIAYLPSENVDAQATRDRIEEIGQQCLLLPGDLGDETHCQDVIRHVIERFEHLDIIVNNAGEHWEQDALEKISAEQLERTFRTNVFAMFYLTKAALPHLSEGAAIVNTTSVTAYRGSGHLLDYSASKGAVLAWTRSLAQSLVDRNIRVNAVAPGPIWTPLIVSTFSEEDVQEFGTDTPMHRPGQPVEVAPCFLFLASKDASYMTGQVLHPNGGAVIGG